MFPYSFTYVCWPEPTPQFSVQAETSSIQKSIPTYSILFHLLISRSHLVEPGNLSKHGLVFNISSFVLYFNPQTHTERTHRPTDYTQASYPMLLWGSSEHSVDPVGSQLNIKSGIYVTNNLLFVSKSHPIGRPARGVFNHPQPKRRKHVKCFLQYQLNIGPLAKQEYDTSSLAK